LFFAFTYVATKYSGNVLTDSMSIAIVLVCQAEMDQFT